jgi:hypothetical protein
MVASCVTWRLKDVHLSIGGVDAGLELAGWSFVTYTGVSWRKATTAANIPLQQGQLPLPSEPVVGTEAGAASAPVQVLRVIRLATWR